MELLEKARFHEVYNGNSDFNLLKDRTFVTIREVTGFLSVLFLERGFVATASFLRYAESKILYS